MLDLDDHGDLVVRALHVAVEVEIEALRPRDADAAHALRRVLAAIDGPLRIVDGVHERHDDPGGADVERLLDVRLVVPGHPHDAGDAAVDGRDDVEGLARLHRGMLEVDEQPVVAGVGVDLGHFGQRHLEQGADQRAALAQAVAEGQGHQ